MYVYKKLKNTAEYMYHMYMYMYNQNRCELMFNVYNSLKHDASAACVTFYQDLPL